MLEKLLTQRPDDPVLTNALGYTLADHNLELPRAESLIERALAVTPDSPAILDSLGWVRIAREMPRAPYRCWREPTRSNTIRRSGRTGARRCGRAARTRKRGESGPRRWRVIHPRSRCERR